MQRFHAKHERFCRLLKELSHDILSYFFDGLNYVPCLESLESDTWFSLMPGLCSVPGSSKIFLLNKQNRTWLAFNLAHKFFPSPDSRVGACFNQTEDSQLLFSCPTIRRMVIPQFCIAHPYCAYICAWKWRLFLYRLARAWGKSSFSRKRSRWPINFSLCLSLVNAFFLYTKYKQISIVEK